MPAQGPSPAAPPQRSGVELPAVSRQILRMSDGHALAITQQAAARPVAQALFLHGLGVEAEAYAPLASSLALAGISVMLPSLRCQARPRDKVVDLDDTQRSVQDVVALVDHVRRAQPSLPLFVGAHSVGCSLLLRAQADQAVSADALFFLAPVWTGHPDYCRKYTAADRRIHALRHRGQGTEGLEGRLTEGRRTGWSFWGMFGGERWPRLLGGLTAVTEVRRETGRAPEVIRRYSWRYFASLRCPDLERVLGRMHTRSFFALADDDEYGLADAIAAGLAWHRPANAARQVHRYARAGHVGVLRQAMPALTVWLRQQLPHPAGVPDGT